MRGTREGVDALVDYARVSGWSTWARRRAGWLAELTDAGRLARAGEARADGRTARTFLRVAGGRAIRCALDERVRRDRSLPSRRPPSSRRCCVAGALSAVELLEACHAAIDKRNGGAPTFDGAPGAINAWARLYPERAARAGAGGGRAPGHARARRRPDCAGSPSRSRISTPSGASALTASSRILAGSVAAATRGVAAPARPRPGPRRPHPHPRVRRRRDHRPGRATRGRPIARPAGRAAVGGGAGRAHGPGGGGHGHRRLAADPGRAVGRLLDQADLRAHPRRGCIPLSPTLDHPGPMARSVADAAALLVALAHRARRRPRPRRSRRCRCSPATGTRPLEGLRVAVTGRPEAAEAEADVLDGLQRGPRGGRAARRPGRRARGGAGHRAAGLRDHPLPGGLALPRGPRRAPRSLPPEHPRVRRPRRGGRTTRRPTRPRRAPRAR